MRILLFLVCYVMPYLSLGQSYSESELLCFYSILGKEKSESLVYFINAFESDILHNSKKLNISNQKIIELLLELNNERFQHEKFYSSLNIKESLIKMEKSGFRKDVYSYPEEIYEGRYNIEKLLKLEEFRLISIDSAILNENFEDLFIINEDDSLIKIDRGLNLEKLQSINNRINFNKDGLYLYALAKSKGHNPFVIDYVLLKLNGVENPKLFIDFFLNNDSKLGDPIIRIILFLELFYPMAMMNNGMKNTN